MKAFMQTTNFARLTMNAMFLAGSYIGCQLGVKLQSDPFLERMFIALDFVWLAAVIVVTFFVSVLILYRTYPLYKLLLVRESKQMTSTLRGQLRFISLGLLTGFVLPFLFQSFFMITIWLIYNL
jgi:hypothetical protein